MHAFKQWGEGLSGIAPTLDYQIRPERVSGHPSLLKWTTRSGGKRAIYQTRRCGWAFQLQLRGGQFVDQVERGLQDAGHLPVPAATRSACTLAALLRNSDTTLDEIARQFGYQAAYAFSEAFLQHIGMRPGAFRNR